MSGALNAANVFGARTLTLSVTDSTPTGSDSGASATGNVLSNTTTVSVTKYGSGSYTYAWAINGTPATDGPFLCNAASSATTSWDQICSDGAADKDEVWTCTVTDTGNGLTGDIDVTVRLTWTDTT